MREKTLIKAIISRLPRNIHYQSMTMGSLTSNGTPDTYLDGPESDMWVEWKQLDAMPRDGLVGGITPAKARKKGCYTTQQYAWMERRWNNGGNVWGVIGLPDKRVVLQLTPEQWRNKSSIDAAISRDELLNRIVLHCTGTPHARTVPTRPTPRDRRVAD